jgi:hypothetical protein
VEKARGPDDPEVAEMLSHRGVLYNAQRRYAEAEPLFLRALAICEKTPDANMTVVTRTLMGLAILYNATGKPADAVIFMDRAMGIPKRKPVEPANNTL